MHLLPYLVLGQISGFSPSPVPEWCESLPSSFVPESLNSCQRIVPSRASREQHTPLLPEPLASLCISSSHPSGDSKAPLAPSSPIYRMTLSTLTAESHCSFFITSAVKGEFLNMCIWQTSQESLISLCFQRTIWMYPHHVPIGIFFIYHIKIPQTKRTQKSCRTLTPFILLLFP